MPTIATRPIQYFGVKLSPNVVMTDEGYLIFKDAVIARTGFQMYKGFELPEDELREQRITVGNDSDVHVLRSAEEVFSPRTIASFEGKPVTDGHPDELVDIESHKEHACGHIQNVRQGKEPLQSGDWPLLADIHVTDKNLINKWESGIRELSCGYNYHIVKQGDNIKQVDIIGNHVAFVENGRAGKYVRVNDTKPLHYGSMNMDEMTQTIMGEGLKSFAEKNDAKTFGGFIAKMFGSGTTVAKDEKPVAVDSARQKYHDMLDRVLDKKVAAMDDESQLAGLLAGGAGAIKSKSTEGLDSEEEQEAEGKKAVEFEKESGATDEEAEADDEMAEADDEESDEDEPEADDEAVQSQELEVFPLEDRPKPNVPAAVDAAYKQGAKAALAKLKPFVARAKSKSLNGAFDSLSKEVNGTQWRNGSSYGKFSRSAGTPGKDAAAQRQSPIDNEQKLSQDANKAYREMRESFRKK